MKIQNVEYDYEVVWMYLLVTFLGEKFFISSEVLSFSISKGISMDIAFDATQYAVFSLSSLKWISIVKLQGNQRRSGTNTEEVSQLILKFFFQRVRSSFIIAVLHKKAYKRIQQFLFSLSYPSGYWDRYSEIRHIDRITLPH